MSEGDIIQRFDISPQHVSQTLHVDKKIIERQKDYWIQLICSAFGITVEQFEEYERMKHNQTAAAYQAQARADGFVEHGNVISRNELRKQYGLDDNTPL